MVFKIFWGWWWLSVTHPEKREGERTWDVGMVKSQMT
uniref:Uncharacterized protein n=1 Tax=Anguilla anguilla TaxID=7936 RepID=A0A0E9SFQ7_ANGAN